MCKQEDLIPAGVFYYSLLDKTISASPNSSEEDIEDLIRKEFKMKGLILADYNVIKMHDNTLNYGTSKMVPASITKSGGITENKTSGVNKEKFKVLQDYIEYLIKQISDEIFSGKIDIKPYYKNQVTACKNCVYKSICGLILKIKIILIII